MNNPPSIAARLRSALAWKLILSPVLYVWFFMPYIFLQHRHFFPVAALPVTPLDRLIPFTPGTVWIYLSNFLLMGVGPYLMNRREQIFRYAIGFLLISTLADIVFLLMPTTCPRPDPAGTNAAYQMVVSVDNTFHAFPSLHAAFAVYSALCGSLVAREFARRRIWQCALWIWALLVLWSTLATKQHLFVDIAAGSALGFAGYAAAFRAWNFNIRRKLPFQTAGSQITQ